MNIIPDPGLMAYQVVPFIVTLVALHYILFKPMIEYLRERDRAIVGVQEQSRELRNKLDRERQALEDRMAEARREAARYRGQLHDQAAEHRNRILAEARQEADAQVSEALERIGEARQEASTHLETIAQELATEMVARVLVPTSTSREGVEA